MAAVDYELLAYQRLKAILLAHAPLMTEGNAAYIRAADWIWYDGTSLDPENIGKVPTSFPRLALEPAGRTEEHWETRQRYGDHDVNATAASLNRKVAVVFNYIVRITHRDLRLTMNSPVEAETMRALRGSNPTMSIPGSPQTPGFDWVRGWGPLTVSRVIGAVETDPSSQSTRRMQSIFPVPVVTVFNSADLLT